MCDFRFVFPSTFVKKSLANRGIEHEDADLKSTDANQVCIGTRQEKKSWFGTLNYLYVYTHTRMHVCIYIYMYKWIMYEFLRQRHWFWWNRAVVSRFRILKWPAGMLYRICDYWLPSVFSLFTVSVFYSRYISVGVRDYRQSVRMYNGVVKGH